MNDRSNKSATSAPRYGIRHNDDDDDDNDNDADVQENRRGSNWSRDVARGSGGNLKNDKDNDNDDAEAAIAAVSQPPCRIKVEGAGSAAVNGIYTRDGYFQNADKYSKKGMMQAFGQQERECTFNILQCHVKANDNQITSKDWFITIVPSGCQPGKETDIDLYRACGATSSSRDKEDDQENEDEYYHSVPPLNGWVVDLKGKSPAPVLSFLYPEAAAAPERGVDETTSMNMVLELAEEQQKNKTLHNRNESLKLQIRKVSTQKETLQQEKAAWLQERNGLLKENQTLKKEMEDLIATTKQQYQQQEDQHKHVETKLQREITTLRTTVDNYKQKELDQLQATCQALQDKVALFEQKEKQQQEKHRMDLAERLAKYEQTNRTLQDELIRKDAQLQVHFLSSSRHNGGAGSVTATACGHDKNNNSSSRHEMDDSEIKLPAVPAAVTTPTPPRNNNNSVKRARLNDDEEENDDKNNGSNVSCSGGSSSGCSLENKMHNNKAVCDTSSNSDDNGRGLLHGKEVHQETLSKY